GRSVHHAPGGRPMTYTFPDVEKAVQHFIRLELPEATIATRFGSKILDKLPFVLVRRTPAQGPTDPRFMDRTIIDVQVLADSREVASEYVDDRAVHEAGV